MNDELTEPRGNRTLLIALAVVAALALLFLFVIQPMLLADEDPDVIVDPVVALSAPATPVPAGADDAPAPAGADDDATQPERGGAASAGKSGEPAQQAEPSKKRRAPVQETFEVFSARDPFQQLVVASSEDGAGAATDGQATGDGDGTGSDDGTGSGTGTGSDPGSGNTQPGNGGGSTSVDGIVFVVTDVFVGDDGEPVALVTVNGKGYEVRQGDVFAEHFEVLDLDESCGTFRYGDERFTLCEGEEIRK